MSARNILPLVVAALTSSAAIGETPIYGPQISGAAPAEAPIGLVRPAGISAELADAAAKAAYYPSVDAGRTSVRAADKDIESARWLRFPSVSVEALVFDGGNEITGVDNTVANLVVDQPIWAGGRVGAGIQRARAMRLVSEYQLAQTSQDVSLRVTNAYFETVRAARRLAIINASLDQHRRLSESIARRVEQEVSARSDLDLANSRTAQLEQDAAIATVQRDSNLQTLRLLIGDPGYDPGVAPRYDAAVHHPALGNVVEEALQCDPNRRRFQAEALVARADVRIAEAAIMPNLSAQYSHNEVTGDRVALVLRAQMGGGLSQFTNVEAAKLRRQASELQVSTAERVLRDAINQDLVENASTRGRIVSNETALTASRTVTESYQRQFTAGRRTWLDVMNAVREATSAELTESDAEISAMASAARILLRTCRWQPQIGFAEKP